VDKRSLVYAPRAERDLLAIPGRHARQVLGDLELLQSPPWPPGKVRKLRGVDFWEIKTGDYRSIFWPRGKQVIILRVVLRRDLIRTLERVDLAALITWLRERLDAKL
jgi:mRNA-degrading endonuclease RelE of RelBE toxin-antitoxin system